MRPIHNVGWAIPPTVVPQLLWFDRYDKAYIVAEYIGSGSAQSMTLITRIVPMIARLYASLKTPSKISVGQN